MSRRATDWAAAQRPPTTTDKMVLWALADASNRSSDGLAFPSIAALCDFALVQRRAIKDALRTLSRCGYIEDTGRRVGRTGQVKVWRLVLDRLADERGPEEPS